MGRQAAQAGHKIPMNTLGTVPFGGTGGKCKPQPNQGPFGPAGVPSDRSSSPAKQCAVGSTKIGLDPVSTSPSASRLPCGSLPAKTVWTSHVLIVSAAMVSDSWRAGTVLASRPAAPPCVLGESSHRTRK